MTYPNMGSIEGSIGVPVDAGDPGTAQTVPGLAEHHWRVIDMMDCTDFAVRRKRGA